MIEKASAGFAGELAPQQTTWILGNPPQPLLGGTALLVRLSVRVALRLLFCRLLRVSHFLLTSLLSWVRLLRLLAALRVTLIRRAMVRRRRLFALTRRFLLRLVLLLRSRLILLAGTRTAAALLSAALGLSRGLLLLLLLKTT